MTTAVVEVHGLVKRYPRAEVIAVDAISFAVRRLPRRPGAERGPRADALLEQFGLRERADSKPDFISGGRAQRIMIARALMHEPHADPRVTGVDVESSRRHRSKESCSRARSAGTNSAG